ncbi:hypothetical protein K431DRAFT_299209 [Polychaeton citri CBS 116435]|uniref:Uncharacterized protein n=1 Tax=Polychaeton citri CBS 116435 TaxID=1314669 RepID=A0A9P4QGM6_9PEZI|nr:hypothetical protein K431DRAFT_299209 [Polychaeton citri CBS 116435]
MDKVKGIANKGIAKGGWHPGGNSNSSSSSGGHSVTGWRPGFMKGDKDSAAERRANHQSAPLTSLRDPDSFGPPPKHSAYYGSSDNTGFQTSSGGLGSAVPPPMPRRTEEEIQAEEQEARQPSGPYQKDTTGLRTDNLPKPPVRRNNDSPVSASPSRSSAAPPPPPRSTASPVSRATPTLPPRLPARQNEYPDENTPAPPPTYDEALKTPQAEDPALINQGAATRLGQAGVSIPGFGIGGGAAANPSPPQSPQVSGYGGQLNELQSRFARMNTNSQSNTSNQSQQGTSWQQKQDAARTAQNFRNDPSSVSMSDARNAASTANNFQQRHGAQMASAAQTAGGLNQKYGISQRLGGLGQQGPARQGQHDSPTQTPASPAAAAAAHKKPPPPPPPAKKPGLGSATASPTTDGFPAGSSGPPPIPHISKPRPT